MTGFTAVELDIIRKEQEQARKRFEKELQYARAIGRLLNEVHKTDYSDKFWLYLLLPRVRRHQQHLFRASLLKKKIAENKQVVEGPKRSNLTETTRKVLKKINTFIRYQGFKNKIKSGCTFMYALHERPSLASDVIQLEEAYPLLFSLPETRKRAAITALALKQTDPEIKAMIEKLPSYLVERFSQLIDKIPIVDPQQKTFHISVGQVEFMALTLALHFELGSSIIRYQHGSHYGEQAFFDSVERFNCTEFHTWGWKISAKDIPDRAYRLEGFDARYRAHRSRPECDLLICFPALARINTGRIRQQSNELINGLDRGIYENILARPRPMARHGNFANDLKFIRHQDIKIDGGRIDIAELVARSKLVLHLEVPSTNFLECMHVGHPVLGIYRNLRPTEIVLPYYQFFVQKGILHFDAQSLCKHLNSLIDPFDWWSQVIKQEEYKDYRRKFCGLLSD